VRDAVEKCKRGVGAIWVPLGLGFVRDKDFMWGVGH